VKGEAPAFCYTSTLLFSGYLGLFPRDKSFSFPSSAGVKHEWSFTSTPHMSLWRAQSTLLYGTIALIGRPLQLKVTQLRRSFCHLGTASITS